jgi:hypothetical protein
MIIAYLIIGGILGLIIGLPFLLFAMLVRVVVWFIVMRRRWRQKSMRYHEVERCR